MVADPLGRLDVSQHMSLCRHYVRELRRSVLIATPELEKGSSGADGSSSSVDSNAEGMSDIPLVEAGPSRYRGSSEEKSRDHTRDLSEFLRSEGSRDPGSPPGSRDSANNQYAYASQAESTPRPSGADATNASPASPDHTVARADIRASSERIMYIYLLPGSEREIVLPNDMVSAIINMIEDDGRDDPEVFDPAKDYVFQAMERDAFPGFLQAKALGNLVPLDILARLTFALLAFFGGFWGAWYAVLRDKPRHIRCWVSSLSVSGLTSTDHFVF